MRSHHEAPGKKSSSSVNALVRRFAPSGSSNRSLRRVTSSSRVSTVCSGLFASGPTTNRNLSPSATPTPKPAVPFGPSAIARPSSLNEKVLNPQLSSASPEIFRLKNNSPRSGAARPLRRLLSTVNERPPPMPKVPLPPSTESPALISEPAAMPSLNSPGTKSTV